MGLASSRVLASDYCKYCFAKSDRRNIEETIRKTRVRIEQNELALTKAKADLMAEASKIPQNKKKIALLMRTQKEKEAALTAAKLVLSKNEFTLLGSETKQELAEGAANDMALDREAKRMDINSTVTTANAAAERQTQASEQIAQLHDAMTDIRSMQSTTQRMLQKEADKNIAATLRSSGADEEDTLFQEAMEFALANNAKFDIPELLPKSNRTTTSVDSSGGGAAQPVRLAMTRGDDLSNDKSDVYHPSDASSVDERTRRMLDGLMSLQSS